MNNTTPKTPLAISPGPWTVEQQGRDAVIRAPALRPEWVGHDVLARPVEIARVCCGNFTDATGQARQINEANAQAIAALPDLIDLAIQYADECSECGGNGVVWTHPADPQDAIEVPCPDCEDIRAVLEKAGVTGPAVPFVLPTVPRAAVIDAVRVAPPETIGYGPQSVEAFRHGWTSAMTRVWTALGLGATP